MCATPIACCAVNNSNGNSNNYTNNSPHCASAAAVAAADALLAPTLGHLTRGLSRNARKRRIRIHYAN